MNLNYYQTLSCRSAVWILYGVAAVKMISAMGSGRILDVPDPLLQVSNRTLLLAVGLTELVVATMMSGRLAPRLRALTLLWLALMFLTYRGFVWLLDPIKPCLCLGFVGSWLGLSQPVVSLVVLGINLYLLLVAAWSLIHSPSAPAVWHVLPPNLRSSSCVGGDV